LLERRAVFVTIPPLLSEIITEAAREVVRLKLVGELGARDALAEQLPALAPDIVLVGLRAGETDDIGGVVRKLVPAAKVLVLSQDGHCAYLHEAPVRRTVLENFSLANLLAALVG
jgi:DNA-binding NarL/FixJ family response regulator